MLNLSMRTLPFPLVPLDLGHPVVLCGNARQDAKDVVLNFRRAPRDGAFAEVPVPPFPLSFRRGGETYGHDLPFLFRLS